CQDPCRFPTDALEAFIDGLIRGIVQEEVIRGCQTGRHSPQWVINLCLRSSPSDYSSWLSAEPCLLEVKHALREVALRIGDPARKTSHQNHSITHGDHPRS